MKDCDPIQQQAIQDRLDRWYVKDGRYRPDHPMHALYSGLADKYMHTDSELSNDD